MRLWSLLTGRVFRDLLQHGKEIEEAIARRDTRVLNHSTPSWKGIFSPLSELPRQNPYPVAALLPLFSGVCVKPSAFSQRVAGFVTFTPCTELFAPSLIMTGALIVISVLLARGVTSGLLGFMAVFIILLVITLVQVLHLLFSHSGNLWPLVTASFALILCRMVMNSSGFVLFTLYCRTQRLARVAREIRLKPLKR